MRSRQTNIKNKKERRIPALRHVAAEGMNVATAERYIERLLSEKKHRARHAGVIKDIRLFYNSLERAMGLVREAGIGIQAERRETDEEIEMVIHIRKPATRRGKKETAG